MSNWGFRWGEAGGRGGGVLEKTEWKMDEKITVHMHSGISATQSLMIRHQNIMSIASKGLIKDLKNHILEYPDNPYLNRALIISIEKNHLDCVKTIIETLKRKNIEDNALNVAIEQKSLESFKLLAPHFNLSEKFNVLCKAAGCGTLEILKIIVSNSCDPTQDKSAPLQLSARNGHVECVQYLLSISSSEDYNDAFILALRNDHKECVLFLKKHIENPQSIIDQINKTFSSEKEKWLWFENLLLSEKINETVEHLGCEQSNRKI